MENMFPKIEKINLQISNIQNTENNFNHIMLPTSLEKHILPFTNSTFSHSNKTLETTIECVGSLYNQSCLYKNLYYVNSTFMILTVKGRYLPPYSVRTNAFLLYDITPNERVFDTYSDLEKFVRTVISPMVIPFVTLHFSQFWHRNIGHALFDGLYPAYVALIRFSPRHLHPFRILAGIGNDNDCWSEDIYSRFGGLGMIKQSVLNRTSIERWFIFEELVMGSGTMCQRCNQPNLQLAGGVELDASRLFRDRMYQQHGLMLPVVRHKSSSEGRTPHTVLKAYIIDNKRFEHNDRKEINDAMNEINTYTDSYFNMAIDNTTKLQWPLIHVRYLYYNYVEIPNLNLYKINGKLIESPPPTYKSIANNFIAQLRIFRRMDIHVTGPGTGQMYQTFLSDGSVNVNLGGIRERVLENTGQPYTSYLEQHMTSGTPYIKGLYYPINERTKGIKKDEVIKLIRQAGQLILEGFSLPVNPRENLALDGQLFVEMCERDKNFCSFVTTRSPDREVACIDLWVEDLVHENLQWSSGGFYDNGENITCPLNRTLLRELKTKYGIQDKVKPAIETSLITRFFNNYIVKYFLL
jgi:hypothetical protein